MIDDEAGRYEARRPETGAHAAAPFWISEVPNLITALGHASTPHTALDAVAARHEPTPTAAAMLVRHVVERTAIRAERALAGLDAAIRAERALAGLDAAIEAELEAAGRAALARAGAGFDTALLDLTDLADERLRQLGRGIEQSLLANLATGVTAKVASITDAATTDPLDKTEDDELLSEALTLVIAAETGRVVTTAEQARAEPDLLLHFPDGAVPARVESRTTATPYATTH